MIDVTGRAVDLLAKADVAARRFNPDARIRVVADPIGVRFVLSDGPEDGDVMVERDGVMFFVDATLEGIVDVEEPHDRLVLRPIAPTDRRRGSDDDVHGGSRGRGGRRLD